MEETQETKGMNKTLIAIIAAVVLVALGGVVIALLRKQSQQDNVFEMTPPAGGVGSDGQKRSISPELLEILADPGDKGPVELLVDSDGKEWLVNRRNGFRYPVEDGIPIMLLEEGEKHKDASLITAAPAGGEAEATA